MSLVSKRRAAKYDASCGAAKGRSLRYPESLGHVVAEVVEQNLDLAEHKLLGVINEGNMTAVIFYLKTKGRERGYSRSRRFSRPRTSRAVGV
jgi:hypothetical protein